MTKEGDSMEIEKYSHDAASHSLAGAVKPD